MKMLRTPTVVPPIDFGNYASDCLRGRCEIPYHIPVPGVPYVQLYVDFGAYVPLLTEFTLQDFCNQAHTEQIIPSNYIVGQTPEGGYYGVFKFFSEPTTPVTSFVVHLEAVVLPPEGGLITQTFFSEIYIDEPCLPLTKIKSCHPEGATETGFDVNDIYYGLPVGTYKGVQGVRYFHIVYARHGKMRELSPQATFSSNLIRNFRTSIDRKWIVETELVPKWYKDYFLAVYSRGAISVNDGPTYLVDGLAFEALNDDDLLWKPYANLKKTTRLYFGCDDGSCNECCTPTFISAHRSDTPFDGSASDSPDESIPDSPADSASDSESEMQFDVALVNTLKGCGGGVIAQNGYTFTLTGTNGTNVTIGVHAVSGGANPTTNTVSLPDSTNPTVQDLITGGDVFFDAVVGTPFNVFFVFSAGSDPGCEVELYVVDTPTVNPVPPSSFSDTFSECFTENFRYAVTIGTPEETLSFAVGVTTMLPDEPMYIDWGDGTVETFNVVTDLAPDHTYLLTGDYVITVRFEHPAVVETLGVGSQPAFTAIEYVSGVFTILQNLYVVDCSLTSVNLTGMPDGAVDLFLQFFANNLTSFDTANIPNTVEQLSLFDNLITTIDGASFPGGLLDISDNPLTSITGATLGFGTWQCQQCNLSVAEVNSILTRLDVNVDTGGTVDTQAQTPPAPPSGAGITAKASLISKSWAVTTD